MITRDHVSTLDLDIYFASGRPANGDVAGHLSGCARCRAYLDGLAQMADEDPPLAAPEHDDGAAPARVDPRPDILRRARRGWPMPGVSAAAIGLAAGVFLFARSRAEAPDYVGTKGTPAVQLLVHHGTDTRVWSGREPIAPGDALAIEVACEGLDHVTVVARTRVGLERVKDVACPAGKGPLPFTLVADDAPGDESFAVVLSRGALGDAELRGAVAESRHAAGLWVDSFVVRKAVGQDR